jgi:O-antigen/teichoic acid export membrane protein
MSKSNISLNIKQDVKSTDLQSTVLGRFIRGVGSTGLSQLLAAANALVLVPLFLRAWGADVYGKWLALTALISYLSLLDLGGQSFIGNLLAQAYVHHDEAGFRRRLSEGVSLYIAISLTIFFVLMCVLAWPSLTLPGQTQVLGREERLIVLFLSIPILLGIPGGVYVTVYRATGCLARGMMVNNVARLIGLLAFVLVLVMGLSPLIYALVTTAHSIFMGTLMVWDVQRQNSFARHTRINLQMAWAGRKFLSGSLFFWLLALAGALNYQGIILVLNSKVTSTVVALYVTLRTAAGLIGYIGNLLQPALWAELTFLHAQQRSEDLLHIVLLSVKAISLLCSIAGVMLWVVLPVIYPIWTDNQLPLDPLLFGIILFQTVLLAGWTSCGWILMASNRHRQMAGWALGNAAITLSLALYLTPRFSAIGVAVATLLGDVLCGLLVYPRLSAQELKVSSWLIYKSIFLPMFLTFSFGLIILSLVNFLQPLLAIIVACTLLPVAVFLMLKLIFTQQEIAWLRSNLNQVRKHRVEPLNT